MTRRARAGLASVAILTALLLGASSVYVRARADLALERATERLFPTVAEVPELTGVGASGARSTLEGLRETPFAPDVTGLYAYASAIEALERGDLPRAAREAQRAAASLDRAADVLVLEGTIARAAMRTEDAEHAVRAALRIAPDHERALSLDADLALDAGDGPRAVQRLSQLVARVPAVGRLHAKLGRAYELVGDPDAAERAYRAALTHDGRDPSTYVNLGRVLGQRGDLSAARDAFARAKTLAPHDASAWLGECLVALTLADGPVIAASCARAAELEQGAPEALIALGDAARARADLDTAVARYTAALERSPSHAVAHTKLGHALFAQGRLADAETEYRRALESSPSLAAAHNGLGVVLGFEGRTTEARASLEHAAALDQRDASPLMNLGLLAERVGDRAQAREAFEAALDRDPTNDAALARLLTL